MEYNNYYANQTGPPSNHQNGTGNGGTTQSQLQPSRPQMMHVPVVSPNIRHAPQAGLPNSHHHLHQHPQQQTTQHHNNQIHSQHIVHNPQLIVPQMNQQTYHQVPTHTHFGHDSHQPQHQQQQQHVQSQHHLHQSVHHQQQQQRQQHHHHQHHHLQQHQLSQQHIHQQHNPQQPQPHTQQHQQQHQQQIMQQHNQQTHISVQHHVQPTQSPHSNLVSPMNIQTMPQSQKMNQITRNAIITDGISGNHSNQSVLQSSHQNLQMQNFYNSSGNTIPTPTQRMQHQHQSLHQHLQQHSQDQQTSPSQYHRNQQQPAFRQNESPSSNNPHLTLQSQHRPLQNNNQNNSLITPFYQPMLKAEGRILELNRWLQTKPMHAISLLPNNSPDDDYWWNLFADEFFSEDATLTIQDLSENKSPMTIGRTLIPRFFKTYLEDGATDLFILLRNPKETQIVNNILALDCDNACIIANTRCRMTEQTPGAIVHSQGHLSLEFVMDSQDNLLIRSWRFKTKSCREFLERDTIYRAGKDIKSLESFSKFGLSKPISLFLNLFRVMEPMQELMMQHQMNNLPPKECLRKYLSETGKYTPDEIRTQAPPKERRKRKPASTTQTGNNTKRSKVNNNLNNSELTNSGSISNNNISEKSPSPPKTGINLSSRDIMIVGDPSMMGCDFTDENARLISIIENSQFEKLLISLPQQEDSSVAPSVITMDNNTGLPTSVLVNNYNNNIEDIDSQTEMSNTENKSSGSPNIDYSKDSKQQPESKTSDQEPLSLSEDQHSTQSKNLSPPVNPHVVIDNEGDDTLLRSKITSDIHQTQEHSTVFEDKEQSTNISTSAGTTTTINFNNLHQQSSNLLSPPETIKQERTSESELSNKSEPQNTLTHDQTCQVDSIDQIETKLSREISTSTSASTTTSTSTSISTAGGATTTESTHNHVTNNVTNSVSEDQDDTRSASADSLISTRNVITSNNKNNNIVTSNKSIGTTTNGIGNHSTSKQNRRRSSDRKETLREGLMRTLDFVVATKDLKHENPALWRITSNNLLQQFEPKNHDGVVLYENTHQYAGWNPEIKKDYVGIDVKLTQHSRNQITVERLLLNFQNLHDPDAFYDKHFVIYLQILISIALDPKFWESIENEPEHHDYFFTSRRIIDDTTKRFKHKLSIKLKLGETALKNVEKYPNLIIKPLENENKERMCRACNIKNSTQLVTFGNRSYDLHSFKPVQLTNDFGLIDEDLNLNLCDACLELVKLYSEIHHTGWRLYNLAKDKVETHRIKGKPINTILDECIKDEEWLSSIYADRDALWSSVDHMQ